MEPEEIPTVVDHTKNIDERKDVVKDSLDEEPVVEEEKDSESGEEADGSIVDVATNLLHQVQNTVGQAIAEVASGITGFPFGDKDKEAMEQVIGELDERRDSIKSHIEQHEIKESSETSSSSSTTKDVTS